MPGGLEKEPQGDGVAFERSNDFLVDSPLVCPHVLRTFESLHQLLSQQEFSPQFCISHICVPGLCGGGSCCAWLSVHVCRAHHVLHLLKDLHMRIFLLRLQVSSGDVLVELLLQGVQWTEASCQGPKGGAHIELGLMERSCVPAHLLLLRLVLAVMPASGVEAGDTLFSFHSRSRIRPRVIAAAIT